MEVDERRSSKDCEHSKVAHLRKKIKKTIMNHNRLQTGKDFNEERMQRPCREEKRKEKIRTFSNNMIEALVSTKKNNILRVE